MGDKMLEEQLGKIIGRVNTKKLRDLYEASRERFKRIDERYAPGHTEAMVELVRGRPDTSEEKLSPLPNGARTENAIKGFEGKRLMLKGLMG
jgi:hypothetical protein